MSKHEIYDVYIDGKGYNFGTRKVRIGGVEYEQKDNAYPLKFIVEKSDLMIMLENHCDIPKIERITDKKTGEHIAKISVVFYGGWTEQVRRLCDQRNTRTIIFIAEKPETAQLEIPLEETEKERNWLLEYEYRDMCFRHNKFIQAFERYEYDCLSPDDKIVNDAISDDPYERICYDSDKLNEFTLPKTDDTVAQAHYDTLRKANPPQANIPEEPEKKPETKLKDFAKSLEVKEPKKVIPFGHEPIGKKVVYKEVTPTAEDVKPKTITPNPENKTYKKTG